jgi:transposase
MKDVWTLGLDLAKGQVVLQRRLGRGQVLPCIAKLRPCLIGLEACVTSHYWASEVGKFGQTVHLMPPAYVKAAPGRGSPDLGRWSPTRIA